MTSFFTEKLAGQDVSDHHLFVTNHPYMIELGLGVFTTGTLYNWWNQRNSDGLYLNRMSVNATRDRAVLEAPPNELDDLLGITDSTEFFWYGWKPNKDFQNAGVYKRQDLSAYSTGWGGDNPWSFDSVMDTVTVSDIINDGIDNIDEPIIGGTLDDSGVTFTKIVGDFDPGPAGAAAGDTSVLGGVKPLYDIINLNRYMTAFTDFYPRSLWDKDDPTIGGKTTKQIFASHELLTEIKSSKLGPYVEWSGEVTFFINENNGTVQCPITEWIPFKLYLFDNANSPSENKAVAVKNLSYVAPKRDVTGKTFASNEDGGYSQANSEDTTNHGAGEIDLFYNSGTGKWEGGSPQLFAKLVTDIDPAVSVPTITHFESNDVKESLDSDNYEGVKVLHSAGTAMPIRPQNGNLSQWQPNYLDPDDVRCATNSKEKETLTVYNFNTKRKYVRDEEVILSRIDGKWFVFPFWPSTDDTDEEVSTDVGKWGEFTYLMTNSQFFFRTKSGARFSPRDAEISFHKLYYSDDGINGNTDYGLDGGYDQHQPFSNKGVDAIDIEHGYAQTTSFDYLDSKLFGIRNKQGIIVNHQSEDLCSISTTSAVVNAAGSVIPNNSSNYAFRNAAHAGTFFGCLFPAGYNGVQPYLDNRTWEVVAESSGSVTVVDPSEYMNTGGTNATFKIFSADDSTGSRNNCRQPAASDPLEPLTVESNSWSRYDSRHSANLFAEYVQNGLTTFRQMPADVMTNASPEGVYGSPLYPVHRFSSFYDTDTGTDRSLLASQALLNGIWLRKSSDEHKKGDSAFDFPPVSRNSLMFRPLKMEAYVQFGEATNYPNVKDVVANLSEDAGSHHTRRGFQVEAHRTQHDSFRPCSYYFEDRESPHSTDLFSNYGLKWGGDITDYKPGYNNLHEFSYWDSSDGAMYWTSSLTGNWRGAGAFGVITTFNTVSASKQIDFSTDNIYGMGAGANGRFTIDDGYSNQDKTWGVSVFSDSYRQENIVDLSVRIFHQHPRDQLLYDPRTFAVHHFNPDVRYEGDHYVGDDGAKVQLTPPRNIGEENNIPGKTPDGPIVFGYRYPIPSSIVDFQEVSRFAHHIDPTFSPDLHGNGVTYDSDSVFADSYVLSDATSDDNGTNWKPPIIKEKFWQINTNRVGKLLPFKYNKREVGVPTPTVIPPVIVIDDNDNCILASSLSNTPTQALLSKMVVKEPGGGYNIGDKIGIANKDVEFKVASIGVDGSVASLECLSRGFGINPGQLASRGDVFNPDSDGPLKLSTIQSAAGGGFDAYFVAAQVYHKEYTDPKPYLVKRDGVEPVRIAADEPQSNQKTNGFTPNAESDAIINETREVSFILDPTMRSENNQYDIFFHFHNDISMTWLASDQVFHGDKNNVSECTEQHVTVRINPR